MSIMAATTTHTRRIWHPHASSNGDSSYSPMAMQKAQWAEGSSRRSSDTTAWMSGSARGHASSTSHFRLQSSGQVPAATPASPSSTASSSPRDSRQSPAFLHPSTSLRASMSFNNSNATSTWASSGLWSSPSSSSSSLSSSLVRNDEREFRPTRNAAGGVSERKEEERSAEEDSEGPLTIARRGHLVSLPRQCQALGPHTSLSPGVGRVDAPASLMDRVLSAPSHASLSERRVLREDSWSPESTRPTLPPLVELRSVLPEFVQGPSRPSFSGMRRDTDSPPPSPSPSTSSFSTNDPSGGRTDTEPTDEDDPQVIKREYESLELPPLKLPRSFQTDGWRSHPVWNATGDRAMTSPAHRPILSPVHRLAAASPPSGSGSPDLPFQHVAPNVDRFPLAVSDTRTRIPFRAELPPLMPRSSLTTLDDATPARGRPALPPHPRSTPAVQPTQPEVLSPTPKKYRFVASKPQIVSAAMHEDVDIERAWPLSSPTGTKRRHCSSSPDSSSEDIPLSHAYADDDGPRKRGRPKQQQPPFDVGLFSASASGVRSMRGPRGAIVPKYIYDTERALTCAFPECGAVLSGKKSETASHMRSHFMQASGKTLHCPWPVESEDGTHVRCGMPFKESANFGRHVSSKHIKAEEYHCNRCGRPFARRDAALRHMKTLCRTDRPEGAGGGRRARRRARVQKTEGTEVFYLYED